MYVLYHRPLNYKVQLPYMQDILGMMFLCDQKSDYGYALNLRGERLTRLLIDISNLGEVLGLKLTLLLNASKTMR